jgi:pilus assembly protein TadC
LKAAEEMGGGGLSKALRQMAVDARITARQVIAERGYKNAVLMVLPAFFAILAIMIILVAPGAVQMISALGAG